MKTNYQTQKMNLFLLLILFVTLLHNCTKDSPSGCADPITTYYSNIDTNNISYKKEKSFIYKNINGNLITTKIISDTTYYNCFLEPNSNPNCPKQNSSCYILKQFYFDTLVQLNITRKNNLINLIFDGSLFTVDNDAIGSSVLSFYPLLDSMKVNNKTYYKVSMVINESFDSLYINKSNGIIQVNNSTNSFKIQ